MLLIMATAVGIAMVRAILPNISAIIMSILTDLTQLPKRGESAASDAWKVALLAGQPVLAAWTVALLLARLRRPGPHLRRVLRQPGAVACAVATLAMVLDTLWIIPMWVRFSSPQRIAFDFVYHANVGHAVFGWLGGASPHQTMATRAELDRSRGEDHRGDMDRGRRVITVPATPSLGVRGVKPCFRFTPTLQAS
jgi:hypothetical protein